MERTFESVMIEQCAPTLAGVKPASLFPWQSGDTQESVAHWARKLAPFGIGLRILKPCSQTGSSLIYLYHAGWLHQILTDADNRDFLSQMGYRLGKSCAGFLEQLSGRLCLKQNFPHEIGIFLGYPLEDVVGFIQHQGRNYTCCGCWKAYGDPVAAQKRFTHYRRCTEVYRRKFRAGTPICHLVVDTRGSLLTD